MDVHGEWSEWSEPISISMPKNKIENVLNQFLIKFFNIFSSFS